MNDFALAPWRQKGSLDIKGETVMQTLVLDACGEPVCEVSWRNGWQPNARLIAAAPDLYEVARKVVESLEWGTKGAVVSIREIHELANAALRKAEGRC
jgi:hypothetical protein